VKKTQNQKWQILALALFVVLGFIGVPMAQQQGTEARAASMKWVENSDGLVLINVAIESDLAKIPEMPIYLVAKVMLKDEPVVAIEIGRNIFKVFFPPAGETKTLTTQMIVDFRTAIKNFAKMVKDFGVPSGAERTIYVRHKPGATFGAVQEGKGEMTRVWHFADLVDPQ